MLVDVASPYGWVEQELPESVAQARIAGGTARRVAGECRVIENAMMNRATQTAAQVNRKPVGRVRGFIAGVQDFFGIVPE